MSCSKNDHGMECKCPELQQLYYGTGNGNSTAIGCNPNHNRWRMAVSCDAAVAGVTVAADLGVASPMKATTFAFSQVGTTAFTAVGGQFSGSMAPGAHQFRARVSRFAGGDNVLIMLETWWEA